MPRGQCGAKGPPPLVVGPHLRIAKLAFIKSYVAFDPEVEMANLPLPPSHSSLPPRFADIAWSIRLCGGSAYFSSVSTTPPPLVQSPGMSNPQGAGGLHFFAPLLFRRRRRKKIENSGKIEISGKY